MTTVLEKIQVHPDELIRSTAQPRKRFVGIDELAASILATGQHDDVKARRRSIDGELELVDGERRKMAIAQLVSQGHELLVNVSVGEYSDAEVLAIALTGRESLTALEQGEGYARLMKLERIDVAECARRVGQEVSHVSRRLRLLKLIDPIRELVDVGKLVIEGALSIAQCPEVAQKRLVPLLRTLEKNQNTITRSDVGKLLAGFVTRALSDAQWKLDDASLPGGACKVCPKRTGIQGELLEVVGQEDVCLDEDCWAENQTEHFEREAHEHRKRGLKVLTAKEVEKFIDAGVAHPGSPYIGVTESVLLPITPAATKRVSVAELVPPDTQHVIGQDPKTGRTIEMVARSVVDGALKKAAGEVKAKAAASKAPAKKPTPTGPAQGSKSAPIANSETAKRDAAKHEAEKRDRVFDRAEMLILRSVADQIRTKEIPLVQVVTLALQAALRSNQYERSHLVTTRRAIKVGAGYAAADKALLDELVRILDLPEKQVLVELLVLQAELEVSQRIDYLGAVNADDRKQLKSWNVDVDKTIRIATQEIENEDRKKAATPAAVPAKGRKAKARA